MPELACELAPVPQRVDVAIVGAGFTGLSAALALRERDLSVAVLESATPGFGASSRNGGMALTGLKLGPDVLERRYGLETARAMFDASLRALDTLEEIVERYGIDCNFDRSGHLEVASKPAHFEHLRSTAELLEARFGHRVRIVEREALGEEVGSSAFYGGLLDVRSAGLDPGKYVRGLAGAATRVGAVVCEQAPVARVRRHPGGWHVETARGDVRASHVIAATGAYTGPQFPKLRRRFVPLGSYVIATEPLGARAREVIARNRMVYDSKRLLHYFRLTPDGRLLFGGRAAFVPEGDRTTERSAAILQRDMLEIFPQLRDVAIDYAWGGTIDVAFDFMPHSGDFDGMRYAFGYAGHGVALATLFGRLAGLAIAGEASSHPFGSVPPGAPFGLYDGRPWFLPFVGAWQQLLDRVS